MLTDRRIERRQLRRFVATMRANRGLPRRATPRQRLRHICNAHPKQFGHLTNPVAVIRRRKHPLAQILRIRLASLVQHSRLRFPPTGEAGITDQPRFSEAPFDSTYPEVALMDARSCGPRRGLTYTARKMTTILAIYAQQWWSQG